MSLKHELFEFLGEPSMISMFLTGAGIILGWLYRMLINKYNLILAMLEKSKNFIDTATVMKLLSKNKEDVLAIIDDKLSVQDKFNCAWKDEVKNMIATLRTEIISKFDDIKDMIELVK